MPDVVEKVKGERSLSEKILSYIPGYSGYKEKELRRETDKLVRDQAVMKLKDAKVALNESIREIADSGNTSAFQYANRSIAALDRVTSKIKYADYGYSGFFDAVKVKEDKLDKLIEFDLTLLNVADYVKESASNVTGQPDMDKAFNDFRKKLVQLETDFNNRENIIFAVSK
jgi:hypothetical protein